MIRFRYDFKEYVIENRLKSQLRGATGMGRKALEKCLSDPYLSRLRDIERIRRQIPALQALISCQELEQRLTFGQDSAMIPDPQLELISV